jgi:hypothetical protein
MFNKFLRVSSALATLLLAGVFAGVVASPSFASGPAYELHIDSGETVMPGAEQLYFIAIQNVGDASTSGPISFSETFGNYVTPELSLGSGDTSSNKFVPVGDATCEVANTLVKCVSPGPLPVGAQMRFEIRASISSQAQGVLSSVVTVSGGGAAVVRSEQLTTVSPPGPFGFTGAAVLFLNGDGAIDTQAGSDPTSFTTHLKWKDFASRAADGEFVVGPVERFKDVITHLPPGLLGNPSATSALCTPDELAAQQSVEKEISQCPPDSQIGVARTGLDGVSSYTPLYNMVPPYGASAELGFEYFDVAILLYGYVRPDDHGIDIVSRNTPTTAPVTEADVTVWGDPTDPSHDRYRDVCLGDRGPYYFGPDGRVCPTERTHRAFLREPTSCSGSPLAFSAESNSYEHTEKWIKASFYGPTMTGCDVVPFSPDITVDPTGTATNSPTGVSVKLSVPQGTSPEGLATADLKKAVVTLPEGMVINPSSADGLQVCDDAHLHLDSNVPAECPDGSKVGTVVLHTELISEPIEGSIYLRPQNSSDPASRKMFRMAIELRDDARGLDFKVTGGVQANRETGRLTTTFDDNPQLPFEDISLQFKSGARAPLVTPHSCVTETTEADLSSWARPDEAVHRSSSFALTSGPGGTPCPGAVLPFAPSFSAGVGNLEAGNFTSFLATFSRGDADQSMQRVSVRLPKGLLGSLVGLPLCAEAQANAGTCSAASEIGSVTAGAGAGPTPFYVTGGKVFMTGPYEGAPFGLSVVVPAKAGPFVLGTVVVRSKVEVDIHTAQLTVTTDPLPLIVGGVPVNLRLVNVTINRPDFTYNPTNCEHAMVMGTMTGGQGTVAALSKNFQVTNCGALKFQPHFSVSTSGKTSRANGASLDSKLSYPKTRQGTEANIAKVKVDLPKQLPSRLTTLQKACPGATFDANPALCPVPSRIGLASATTPVLPVPLNGPVYFVSHGGEAFPDLVIVLQGYGVTVELVGTTFISKAGITSTTFKTVPDVPVGTFELRLPQGPYSALATNGDLCKAKLKMPTAFVAQDGAEIHQATPIAVSGCARHKAKKARRADHKKRDTQKAHR